MSQQEEQWALYNQAASLHRDPVNILSIPTPWPRCDFMSSTALEAEKSRESTI